MDTAPVDKCPSCNCPGEIIGSSGILISLACTNCINQWNTLSAFCPECREPNGEALSGLCGECKKIRKNKKD